MKIKTCVVIIDNVQAKRRKKNRVLGRSIRLRVLYKPLQSDVNILLFLARNRVAANLAVLDSVQVSFEINYSLKIKHFKINHWF
jgi:hypothetical protein